MTRSVFACALATLSLALAAGSPPAAAQQATPRFEEAPCTDLAGLSPAVAARLRCGTVAVPRLAGVPEAGTFRLQVWVFKAAQQPARPDAIALLPGGPGEATRPLAFYEGLPLAFPANDVVLFDHRAIGRSEPQGCDAARHVKRDFAWLSHHAVDLSAAWREAMRACLAEARANGLKPEEFGSAVNADDVERIRIALGYTKLDLIGTSYGAVTGLEFASRYPDSVRALVLNSPSLGAHVPIGMSTSWSRARLAILAECAGAPTCARDYPDLQRELQANLAKLDDAPWVVSVPETLGAAGNAVVLDSSDLEILLFTLSYDREGLAAVPQLVRAFTDRNPAPVIKALERAKLALANGITLFPLVATLCRDGAAAPWAAGSAHDGVAGIVQAASGNCDSWAPVDQAPTMPAGSTVPILALAGLLDPVTPPSNARTVATIIGANARVFEFASTGHGVVPQSLCGTQLIGPFFEDPSAPLALECLAHEPPLQFLSPERKADQ